MKQNKNNKTITIAHGAGGNLSNFLIKDIIKGFNNTSLNKMDDAGIFNAADNKFAFSTDSFVVDPIFFEGGDIGKLSVCGTVNDISMMGAKSLAMSLAMIIEEGFDRADLIKISNSIAVTAKKANISVITGDTKVVDKGKVDKIFINTSAVGIIDKNVNISASNAEDGDDVIISGNIGEHAASIMMKRNNFKFKTKIKSDCSLLNGMVSDILKVCSKINVLRDPTRGGIASALNEIAFSSNKGIILDSTAIPVSKEVYSFCSILGLDPLYMANEGKLISIQSSKYTKTVLETIKKHPLGKNAKIIGKVVNSDKGVFIKTVTGSLRKIINSDLTQYPRIC